MQGVHVADCPRLIITGGEARAGLPVVERDAQLILARRQGRDVDFPA